MRIPFMPVSTLRVLTYNVYAGPPTPTSLASTLDGSDRLRRQVDSIRELAPDVVCLQEIVSDGVREYYADHLADEYEASFVLTSHELRCKIGKIMRGALDHIGPQTTISGFIYGSVQSGLMVLHRRATLERTAPPHAISFSEQAGDLLNIFRPRGALCVPLQLRADGSPVVVTNTHANAESAQLSHLSHLDLPSVPEPSPYRSHQLTELFGHASGLAAGARVVVCGDLNSAPDLGEIPFAQHGFVDATAPSGSSPLGGRSGGAAAGRPLSWDGTRNPLVSQGWFSAGDTARTQLDYIFTSEGSGLVPLESRLALDSEPWLSDHFGVLTRFRVGAFSPRRAAAAARRHARAAMPERRQLRRQQLQQPPDLDVSWGI